MLNKKRFIGMLKKDICTIIFEILTGVIVVFLMYFSGIQEKKYDWIMLAEMLLYFSLTIYGNDFSARKYAKYSQFAFSRRSFFYEQCILSIVKGALFGVVRTWLQIAFYNSYVAFFIEDTDATMGMYGRVNFLALFLFNMLLYTAVSQVMLIDNTLVDNLALIGVKKSLQNTCREMEKKRNSIEKKVKTGFGKLFSLVLIVATSVLSLYSYDLMLTGGVKSYVLCLVAVVGVCFIAFIIGKCRYKPKYL